MRQTPDAIVFVLACIVVFAIIFLAYSTYMVKTDLEVHILNQTSSCYSGQKTGSEASWSNGSIAMESVFETPDPCYRVSSVKAVQQGNKIEVDINTVLGGACIQCFGIKKARYEITLPEMKNDIDIYVQVDSANRHYVWLPFLG